MAARLVAVAAGESTAEPREVVGLAAFDPTEGTDTYAIGAMRFGGEVLAKLACWCHRCATGSGSRDRGPTDTSRRHPPLGSRGIAQARPGSTSIAAASPLNGRALPGGTHIFTREVDSYAAILEAGALAQSQTVAASLANMRTLDRWRRAVGLHYSFERR